jgi:phenylalanyl-tRNA synthetase beta chain
MRVPLSWLREHVQLASEHTPAAIGDRLTAAGLKVEHVEHVGDDIAGVVVAEVRAVEELVGFKKPIRWVALFDGTDERHVICGATNFVVGDVIAYARPPATLPGGFRIDKRSAYGRESDGMICSARELGLGDDHDGILVLDRELPLGTDVIDALSLRDHVLDVNVNPDRGYALSVRGVAREVASAFGADFRDPAHVVYPGGTTGGHPVVVDDVQGCDRYVARIVTSVHPAATSPQWLQRRLTLAGMRPISLAVDITNYVMLDLGQPLHAFDRDKVRGPIVVRRARAGERITTLDGVDRSLDEADLLITDDSGPVAIAGVMGGATTEIGATTTAIVLESAHFDPASIAATARRHKLGSEASRRYERGVDDALAPAAAQAAVAMLEELGGAAASTDVTDVDRRPPRPMITLDPRLPGRLAGLDYADEVVRDELVKVGCRVEVAGPPAVDRLLVEPPSWRPDLRRPVDLVEEVVRLQGYDLLPATLPRAPAGRGLTRPQRLRRTVGRALAAAGYAEVLTAPFVSLSVADEMLLGSADARRPSVRVANPVSEEDPYLRSTLLPGLLAALARNVGRGFSDVALFEVGSVFRARPDQPPQQRLPAAVRPGPQELAAIESALPFQPIHLAAALTGHVEPSGWWGAGREATWADAIEAARTVASSVGVELDVTADVHMPWHPGRCAALSIAGRTVGHAGELHPRATEAFGLPPRTCALELRLDDVLAAAPETGSAPRISAFPPALLDVALVVSAEVPAAAVRDALLEGAGPLLEDLRLFDVYDGPQVDAGYRSLAFRLRLRAADRTLTAEETAAARDSAVAAAAARFGAVLRGS